MNDSSGRRRGRPNKGHNDVRVKYAMVSAQDRARLLDCSRRGGDLPSLARTLGINIKTARSIVRTDRDLPKARGGSKSTFNVDVLTSLTKLVDDHPTYTLKQLKSELQRQRPGLAISTSSIDRLLDGHGYSLKQVSLQPADRNRADVKEKRKVFATWLEKDGPQTLRFYVDETNFNIWCSRKFGRSKRGTEAVQKTTASRGPNINIIACMSAEGLLLWKTVDRVSWLTFNEFLEDVSRAITAAEPDCEAVIIMDNAPAHRRAKDAAVSDLHTVMYLPPYSPFFNPIEELFSKFKLGVKAYMRERSEDIFTRPDDITVKEHRWRLLQSATQDAMQKIHQADCRAYDRHSFEFVAPALDGADM